MTMTLLLTFGPLDGVAIARARSGLETAVLVALLLLLPALGRILEERP